MKNIVILCLCASGLFAQPSNGVVILGTPYPRFTISPGQITTLSFTGASTMLPVDSNLGIGLMEASNVPLPTNLGGFSATINQDPHTYMAPLPSSQ